MKFIKIGILDGKRFRAKKLRILNDNKNLILGLVFKEIEDSLKSLKRDLHGEDYEIIRLEATTFNTFKFSQELVNVWDWEESSLANFLHTVKCHQSDLNENATGDTEFIFLQAKGEFLDFVYFFFWFVEEEKITEETLETFLTSNYKKLRELAAKLVK